MKDRNTAGKLGFIKDSEGVYRKGSFIYKDGKIIRESNIVPEGTIEDVEDNYTTMGECIRSVLSYSTTLGEPPRSTDVYIDKVGNNYKVSNKFSKNTVAVVTSQRQVIEIKARDITEQTDDKSLENKDAEDKPVNPKEIKNFSKPEDIETKTKKELKESEGEDELINKFKNGFASITDLVKFYGSKEKALERLKYYDIDLLDYDINELSKLKESSKRKLKLKESDATPEFLNDLKDLVNKHTRAEVTDIRFKDGSNEFVEIEFPNGYVKTIDIGADSNLAAISDIVSYLLRS